MEMTDSFEQLRCSVCKESKQIYRCLKCNNFLCSDHLTSHQDKSGCAIDRFQLLLTEEEKRLFELIKDDLIESSRLRQIKLCDDLAKKNRKLMKNIEEELEKFEKEQRDRMKQTEKILNEFDCMIEKGIPTESDNELFKILYEKLKDSRNEKLEHLKNVDTDSIYEVLYSRGIVSVGIGNFIFRVALTFYEKKDYPNASEWFNKSFDIMKKNFGYSPNTNPAESRFYFALSQLQMNHHFEAKRIFKEIIDIPEDSTKIVLPIKASCYVQLGLINKQYNELETARNCFQRASKLFAELKNYTSLVEAMINEILVLLEIIEMDRVEEFEEIARPVGFKEKYSIVEFEQINRGVEFEETDRAVEFRETGQAEKSNEITQAAELTLEALKLTTNKLGGQHALFFDLLRIAALISKSSGNTKGASETLNTLVALKESYSMDSSDILILQAEIQFEEEKCDKEKLDEEGYVKSLKYLKKALYLVKAKGEHKKLPFLLRHIGYIYHTKGKMAKAIKYYVQGLKCYVKRKDPDDNYEIILLIFATMDCIEKYPSQREILKYEDVCRKSLQLLTDAPRDLVKSIAQKFPGISTSYAKDKSP